MIRAAIFDIDGTLADATHRHTHLTCTPKDWDGFFSKMMRDAPKPNVIELARSLARTQTQIVVVTGRPERYRDETEKWLEMHQIPYAALFMRGNDDRRVAEDFKAATYEQFIRPVFKVRLVVEDDPNVVEMWRELGLECWQVAEKGVA